MEDWQKDIMDAIRSNRWKSENVKRVETPRAKVKSIPTDDMDFILDIVYFAARKLKGKSLTPEHEELFNEYDDVLRNQGIRGFHDANVQTHANVRDEDTDERDEKYYPNDRLHPDVKKSWTDILKSPFPNHMLNRRQRGKRPVIKGTGKNGLFTYDEIDEKLSANVSSLIDERYEKEIKKKTNETIKEANKTLKEKMSGEMKAYISDKVRNALTEQKLNNVYATAYGDYANPMTGSKGRWFSGGLSALGYNPEDSKQMSQVMRRISGLGKQYFHDWSPKKEEEEEKMSWKDYVKKAHCMAKMGKACSCAECEKQQFEKNLVGNQKRIDANKDGKITGEDFAMLRDETKKAKVKCPKCDGKGCEHCNYTGYHETKGKSAFTARD
jgi:hypothetical protein